jgi:hypothetical protein
VDDRDAWRATALAVRDTLIEAIETLTAGTLRTLRIEGGGKINALFPPETR